MDEEILFPWQRKVLDALWEAYEKGELERLEMVRRSGWAVIGQALHDRLIEEALKDD